MIKFHCLVAFMGNMCIVIVCQPGCNIMNFEIKLYLSNQVVFAYMTKKSQKKLKYLEDEKR